MSTHTLTQNWELLHRFLKCPAQQKAFNTILDELLGGDLIWTGENADGRNYFARIQPTSKEYTIWSRFIKRLLHELCVYGFAMYRMVRVPASTTTVAPQFRGEPTTTQHEFIDVEVENGVKLIISWDPVALTWDIKSKSQYGSFLKSKDHGWNLLMLNEPIKTTDTNVVLNSCASHAYDASMNLAVLDRNYSYRDFINSTVVVTTQESAEVASADTAASSIPTGQMAPVLGSASTSRSTDEFIAQSKKRIEQNGKVLAISRQQRLESFNKAGSAAKRRRTEIPDQIPHYEVVVQDGNRYETVDAKVSQGTHLEFTKRLRHDIAYAFGVPPHVTGENVNSERMAGSDRMSQMGIARYDNFIKRVRKCLQTAVRKMSSMASGKPNVFIKLWPCIGSFALQQAAPILTDMAARRLYSSTLEIPEDFISQKRLSAHIDAMVETPDTDTRSGNAHDKSAGKTQAAKKKESRDKKTKTA